jgi:hypothetical protein
MGFHHGEQAVAVGPSDCASYRSCPICTYHVCICDYDVLLHVQNKC